VRPDDLALFALDASRPFGEALARALGVALAAHEEREFEDGEHKTRPLDEVRGRDAYLVQSLYSGAGQSVNDRLVRALFLVACLRDAGAAQVTVLAPYLGYARKDRRTQPQDPVTSRYLAQLFEAVGTNRVVTLEVHNEAAFQNAFRCPTEHLVPDRLFVEAVLEDLGPDAPLVVLSPDAGGVKRAERFRRVLGARLGRELSLAFMEKARSRGELRIGRLVGEVDGSVVVIIDDLISTGGTLLGAARACREAGARRVLAAAAHGVFVGRASEVLGAEALDRVLVTDTIPPLRLDPALLGRKVRVLPAAVLFAEAVRRLHGGAAPPGAGPRPAPAGGSAP
jgi:ribose-phosphate pyrophosphokinase